MNSIRTRLLTGMIGSIAVVLLLFGAVMYAMINRSYREEFDFSLENLTRTLAAAALVEKGVIEVELVPEMIPDFQETEHRLFYQFWVEDGSVLDRSASLAGNQLPQFHGPNAEPVFRSIQLPNGAAARAAGIRFRPAIEYPRERREGVIQADDAPLVTVVVARDMFNLRQRQSRLRWLLFASGIATMAVGCLVSAIIIDRGMGPLRKLAGQIAAIKEQDLTARVGSQTWPSEIAPVAERLNDLLRRLQAAFDRERNFASDVAHELRTPLAGIHSTLEVTQSTCHTLDEYKEALDDTLSISKRLQVLVERLLRLARLESGQLILGNEPIRLSEAVDACWQPRQELASKQCLVFENRVPASLSLNSDHECLITVLNNLLENSVEYADQGGRVWVTGTRSNGSVEISVSNTGCTIKPDQVDQVFDRFWRGDPSRTETGVHCGLGLSLVHRIVTNLGGCCSAAVDDQAVFTVQVVWPQTGNSN